MRITLLVLTLSLSAYAQPNPKLRPIAALPAGTSHIAQVTPVSDVAYWKLLKLASDEEANLLRAALIQSDRGAVVTEICASAGLKVSECQISKDVKTVTKR